MNLTGRKFLVEMETLDGIVIDFGLNQEKFELQFREKHGKKARQGKKHAKMSTTQMGKKWIFSRVGIREKS